MKKKLSEWKVTSKVEYLNENTILDYDELSIDEKKRLQKIWLEKGVSILGYKVKKFIDKTETN